MISLSESETGGGVTGAAVTGGGVTGAAVTGGGVTGAEVGSAVGAAVSWSGTTGAAVGSAVGDAVSSSIGGSDGLATPILIPKSKTLPSPEFKIESTDSYFKPSLPVILTLNGYTRE